MKARALSALAGALLLCLQAAPVAGKGLITAKELAGIAADENVRIVSVRKPDAYAKVHIKGAVHVDLQELYQEGEVVGLLRPPEEIAAILGEKGISESNTIAVYDGGTSSPAGRLYWILEYLGATDVRMLDGQMKAWRKARKKVTKKATPVTPVTFNAAADQTRFATADEVRSEGVLVVDVRSPEEFAGEKGPTARLGHIPGAVNFEHTNVLADDGTIGPAEELRELLSSAGITPDKDIILYCNTSTRAGLVYLVLDGVLEYPKVRVYDGALYEWAANPENPVE